jgi:WD40 repeat protein
MVRSVKLLPSLVSLAAATLLLPSGATAVGDDPVSPPRPRPWSELKHEHRVVSVSFSPDGKALAAGWGSFPRIGEVTLWDIATGKARATLKGHTGGLTSVTFSPDGKTLASASDDQTVKLWDVATGKETATFKGHSEWVKSVSFSPDGKPWPRRATTRR